MTVDIPLTVVGSINSDITATTSRLPGAGETVGGGVLTRDAGGKGANQAAAAARLGARTRMIGAVGADASGDDMRRALADAGVDVSGVITAERETGTALIMVDAQGENQISVCEGANAEVTLDGIEFTDDETVMAQLEISIDTVTELARRCRGFFVLNAAPAMPLPDELLHRADLVIVNETEYALIPELADAALVAVTYGAEGSALFARGERLAFAPAKRARPVNTVGAGDAFCAALTIALRSGLSHEDALHAANAVGAAAVEDPSSRPRLGPLGDYLRDTADA